MGTHPIFESDFDCLTEMSVKSTKTDGFSESDSDSLLSERSGIERKRSSYSEFSASSNGSQSTPRERRSSGHSGKYAASVMSRATNTTRQSTLATNRSNASSAIRSVGKKRSAMGPKVAAGNAKKLDPVTARILSANHRRRAQLNNQAGEYKHKNQELMNEIKSLRIQCKRLEKELNNLDNTQSALPQVLQRFEDDKRVLKDRLRKAKESERKLEREKKRAEGERERQGRKIKEMEEIIKAKNLAEKFDWRQKCAEAEERAQAAKRALADGEKNAALKTQMLERQVKKESRRRAKAEKMLQTTQGELRIVHEKMKERDRQLSVLNIYSQRSKKPSRNVSFHEVERDISLPSITYPDLESSIKKLEAELDARSSTGKTFDDEQNVARENAFLTEVPHPAEVDEAETERELEARTTSLPKISTPEKSAKKSNEKSADDLLDEMLGLGAKDECVESPTILSLAEGSDPEQKSPESAQPSEVSPQFSFEPSNGKKDSILAQLRDLHANAEPETAIRGQLSGTEPIAAVREKKNDSIFNIFDDVPDKPIIDPKEFSSPIKKAPSVESIQPVSESASEDIDELLDLKPVRKAKTTKTTSHNYDWVISQPMKNLHEGKASNGKDYSKTSKDNLIDNLFGEGGRSNLNSRTKIDRLGVSSSRQSTRQPLFLF